MKAITRALLFSACLSASLAAMAQYQWTDQNGRRVFSDRPPPSGEQVKDMSNKSLRSAPAAPAAPAASAPATSADAGVDKKLQARKQQAEEAEAAKKKAEEEKLAAARAENCKRAREVKAGLDSGIRLSRTNAKGETEILDDAQRAAEARRVQGVIDQDCK